jgi:antitoxin YefM
MTREPHIIERGNGVNVALIPEGELNALLETAHLLSSRKNAARLAAALTRARAV